MGRYKRSIRTNGADEAPSLFTDSFCCVDLFCGAGGLSLGLKNAGLSTIRAIDCNKAAIQTYRANLGDHVEQSSIADEIELPVADVIVGGPPCQGFSSAGSRRQGDHRNSLVSCFARIVARQRPQAFIFENVEGFLTSDEGAYVFDLLTPLVEAGYEIHLRKVNAANYGVPQHRKRVIAIGGLGWPPNFPEATHTAFGAPGAGLAGNGQPRSPTLQEAIADLPEPTTQAPSNPHGHFYRPLVGIDLERAQALKPGQTMRDLPPALWHNSYKRRANRRVMDGTPTERRGGPPAGVRRLLPDEPCKAITGGVLSEFLHPYEHRNLTLRECARIQTFPDDFLFFGNTAEQVVLIGNAVPVLLATVIGRTLLHDLTTVRSSSGRGCLLSFAPTLSSGMSPVLEKVTNRVRSEFSLKEHPQELSLWD